MNVPLEQTHFYELLTRPGNEASKYLQNSVMHKDVWNIKSDLPVLAEEAHIIGAVTLNFQRISLTWLRQLTKLAVFAKASFGAWKLATIKNVLTATGSFSFWLLSKGYVLPSALTVQTVQQWGSEAKKHSKYYFQSLLIVFRELGCIRFEVKWKKDYGARSGKTVPEEVKQQFDQVLQQLDAPIYLVFKLHAALATRSREIGKIPLDCLRRREEITRIRIPTGKQNDSLQEQDLPEVLVPLVQQQQEFVRHHFGRDFPWLFPNWQMKRSGFSAQGWPPTFEYLREQPKTVNKKLNNLLRRLIEQNDIRTRDGQLANITTHQFRRTYGTLAYRLGKRPDQIKHGLRHLNSDMQDAYVILTPQEQEKNVKVFVNHDGQRIVYKTDHNQEVLRREWQVRETELGLCGRPNIISDCEYEHICLSCKYAYYTREHLPQLQRLQERNHQLLAKALGAGQSNSRRAHSACQQIKILHQIIVQVQESEEGQAAT